MVHTETQKVKVLRANQKNAKKTSIEAHGPGELGYMYRGLGFRASGVALNPKP